MAYYYLDDIMELIAKAKEENKADAVWEVPKELYSDPDLVKDIQTILKNEENAQSMAFKECVHKQKHICDHVTNYHMRIMW